MKTNYLIACLFSLAGLSISCSNNAIDELDMATLENSISVSADSTHEVTVISSLNEFYQFLAQKTSLNSLTNDYLLESPTLSPQATISTVTKNGYTNFSIYEGCENLEISFSDFQTADKLGLIAHKTYFITIGLANHLVQLQSNQRPSVAESLECGLLLENPRTDNFVTASRGYVGQYDSQKLQFSMNTSLVYFLDYTDDPKIWFPCNPENLKWNVNILSL